MRRLLGLVLPALLAVSLLLPATAAAAADDVASTALVLATEADPGATAPGRDPMPVDATENPAAPAEYEPPFLIGAAWGLLALVLFLGVALAGLYFLLVVRPAQKSAQS